MKTIKFIPSVCKEGEGKQAEGYVELRGLGIEEKMAMLESTGIELDDSGAAIAESSKNKSLHFILKAIQAAKTKYVKVDIKANDGEKYESYEDLDFDAFGQGIIKEVALAMLTGFKPGND